MNDEDYEKYDEISAAVKTLVDEKLNGYDSEAAEEIRQKLTEEFRFWSPVNE